MAINQFESSRVAGGTLNPGAQTLGETSHAVPQESNAISRDDVRDGFEPRQIDGQIMAANTLVGVRVHNSEGQQLGKIHQIVVDVKSGRIAYAVLSFGGFFGIGDNLFAVPWSTLRFDTDEKEFSLDIGRKALEDAPRFDADNWPDMANPKFATAVNKHYGTPPYWQQDVTDAGDYIGDNTQRNRSIEHEPVTSYRPVEK